MDDQKEDDVPPRKEAVNEEEPYDRGEEEERHEPLKRDRDRRTKGRGANTRDMTPFPPELM